MRPSRKEPLPLEILDDPVLFAYACWGGSWNPNFRLYDKQEEVLLSLRDNYETTVHAANEVGKDFIASVAVVWFFASRSPARVITSSSGETQLKSILWTEIKQRIATSRFDLSFIPSTLNIKRTLKDGEEDPLSYVIGHVTKTVENFQGHHLDHDIPRVMAIFDECSAIGDEFHEAAESWAHRILNIGNPMNTTNYFYRTCKKGNVKDPAGRGGLLSNVIHISGDDSPNVKLGKQLAEEGIPGPYTAVIPGVLSFDEYVRRESKWDAIKKHIRLHGMFYEGESALMFPPDWLDAAEASYRELNPRGYSGYHEERYKGQELAMGVDCGAGRDLSVWTVIDRKGVLYQEAMPTPDTSRLSSRTKEIAQKYRISPARICFDAGGGGKQIVDHMRISKRWKKIRSISFGSAATPPPTKKVKGSDKVEVKEDSWVYKNKRAEMHGILREWIDPSINDIPFAIPEDLYQCREDLAVLPMWFDQNDKLFLPPKDTRPGKRENPDEITIKKLLGRSPDRGDSLVLAVYAMAKRVATKVGAVRHRKTA